jgi:signal transduction histidine kinase
MANISHGTTTTTTTTALAQFSAKHSTHAPTHTTQHDTTRHATTAHTQHNSTNDATHNTELRTPLHGIIASTSMLLEAIPPSAAKHDPTRDNAEIIRDCGEHMLALINNILDIERIESKRLQLECLPFKPVQELEALLKVFAAQAEQKRIQLRKCVDVRYPVRIGDPLRIKQILFNLVRYSFYPQAFGQVSPGIADNGTHHIMVVTVVVVDDRQQRDQVHGRGRYGHGAHHRRERGPARRGRGQRHRHRRGTPLPTIQGILFVKYCILFIYLFYIIIH